MIMKLNEMKRNPQVMLKVLIVTSVMMFLSIFTLIPKILGVTMSIWILNIVWIMYLSLGDRRMNELISVHEEKIDELTKDKKYVQSGIRMVALPLSIVGLIIVFLSIVVLFVK